MTLARDSIRPIVQNYRMQVTSREFLAGEMIPEQFSNYSENKTMPLTWTPGPMGTQSYALIMEDPDAHTKKLPVTHWLIWNIPGHINQLESNEKSQFMSQGLNAHGQIGYLGPRPPEGDPVHGYHIQVFALDTHLDLQEGSTMEELLAAMEGHVLSSGELLGNFIKH